MSNAYLFLPLVKDIISQSRLPEEFLYLAMAESGFSVNAYSNKSASGLWQFMPQTAKKYGLHIDKYVDERRDLVKSTKAAVKYLEELHDRFGKWYLAALAYNCGEGCVLRAIKRAKTDDLEVLIDPKKRYLPRESRNYIRKILAYSMVASNDTRFDEVVSEVASSDSSIVAVDVARGEMVSRVAKMLEMPVDKLRTLNRHLKHDFVPPYDKTYHLYLPSSKLQTFKERYKPSSLVDHYLTYRVKKGDTLSQIGVRYGVNYKIIQEFNNLKTALLRAGQNIVIPVEKSAKKLDGLKDGEYVVKRGDSLTSIAKAFDTTIAQLEQINNLKSTLIRAGERLNIHD